jgi:hypothetical protein
MPKSRPLEERFWEKVQKTDGCWEWTASRSGGYGYLGGGPGKGLVKAHRVSWELHNGLVPVGLCVLHRCDNPGCVRPDHLYVGTQKQNAEDREARGRMPHACGDGHWTHQHPEWVRRGNGAELKKKRPTDGERNGRSKLLTRQVKDIRELYTSGEVDQAELASIYGVDQTTISNIIVYKTWKNV